MYIDLPCRMLTETVGNLYVGGYERPFAVINVKVLVEYGFIIIMSWCCNMATSTWSTITKLSTHRYRILCANRKICDVINKSVYVIMLL